MDSSYSKFRKSTAVFCVTCVLLSSITVITLLSPCKSNEKACQRIKRQRGLVYFQLRALCAAREFHSKFSCMQNQLPSTAQLLKCSADGPLSNRQCHKMCRLVKDSIDWSFNKLSSVLCFILINRGRVVAVSCLVGDKISSSWEMNAEYEMHVKCMCNATHVTSYYSILQCVLSVLVAMRRKCDVRKCEKIRKWVWYVMNVNGVHGIETASLQTASYVGVLKRSARH